MSLLALMADKFELEPAPSASAASANESVRPLDEHEDNNDLDSIRRHAHDDLLHGDAISRHIEKHLSMSMSQDVDGKEDEDEFEENCNDNSTDEEEDINADRSSQEETKLLITFVLMVIVGTANKVFQKLQAIPMYNYPNSLNLLQNFAYVPLCFAYILPVSRFGLLNNAIPHEVSSMSKKPYIIMGLFDCITCILLTFASVYLPGSLLILLPQAAIPISMILSNKLKGESYAKYQYLGATVVVLGILVVLEPLITQRHAADFTCEAYDQDEFCALCEEELTEEGCLSHRTKEEDQFLGGFTFVVENAAEHHVTLRTLAETNSTSGYHEGELCRWVTSESAEQSSSGSSSTTTLIWSVVTILACIPMTLSSIYKEMSLSDSQTNIDPIFLNGWVAFYQLMFSFPLSVPAGITGGVMPSELPKNIWDGIKCYLGIATIMNGCHPDDKCPEAPLYVNVFLMFNVMFNILIVYILKFGSANVLFMASTVMVPIGNLAFALPFMPGSQPLKDSDIAGLMVILFGLVTYRFGNNFNICGVSNWRTMPPCPWRRGNTRYRRDPGVLNEAFAWDAPVFDDENEASSSGLRSPSTLLQEPLLSPVQ